MLSSNPKLSKFLAHFSNLLDLTPLFHTPIILPKPLKHSIIKHRNITNSISYIILTGLLFFTLTSLLNLNPVFLPHLALTYVYLLIFFLSPTRGNGTQQSRLISYPKNIKSLQHQPNQSPYQPLLKIRPTLLILFHTFYITLFLTLPTPANAQNQPNPGTYRFKFVNSGSLTDSTSSSTISNLTPPVKQPDLKALLPFSFTISDISIDFGLLSPNTFATQTNTLSVSAGNANGYSVSVIQNHPLKLSSTSTSIPNITAGTWTSPEQYGFGYSINPPYFKPFADQSLNQTPETIMTSSISNSNSTINLTYQANISTAQNSGDYQNKIIFLALPTY